MDLDNLNAMKKLILATYRQKLILVKVGGGRLTTVINIDKIC